jgi:hypothetical protein
MLRVSMIQLLYHCMNYESTAHDRMIIVRVRLEKNIVANNNQQAPENQPKVSTRGAYENQASNYAHDH